MKQKSIKKLTLNKITVTNLLDIRGGAVTGVSGAINALNTDVCEPPTDNCPPPA
jgi:hypothetical protein